MEYRDEPEFESGQIVIDKQRSWTALCLTMWMNEYSDYWYRHIYGDKETFHFAWRRLNQPYAMPGHPIHHIPSTFCQHDFDGRRVFQHRNHAKWSLASNPQIPGFQFEEDCLNFLTKLKLHQEVTVGVAPSSPRRVVDAARRICIGRFVYKRVGYDSRIISFKPDGSIGEGKDSQETEWSLYDQAGQVVLDIRSKSHLTCRLRRYGDIWRGKWERFERMPIELSPYLEPNDANRSNSARVIGPKGVMGVTIGIGDRFLKYACRAAQSVRDNLGIPTAILSEATGDDFPKRRLLRMFDHFDGTIFYFDADTIALKSWDISDYVGIPEIVCVRDIANSAITADCAEFGLDQSRYFNAGILIINRKHHQRVLEEASAYRFRTRFTDQTILNIACQRLGVPLLFLDSTYNMVGYATRGAPEGTVIAHAAGGRDKRAFDGLFPLPVW